MMLKIRGFLIQGRINLANRIQIMCKVGLACSAEFAYIDNQLAIRKGHP